MSRFGNTKKTNFLLELPASSIAADGDLLATFCKFNFAYFTVQEAGQSFQDWSQVQLAKLLDKLRDYSKESLAHWRNQRVGNGVGRVLSIYDAFPSKTEFKWPKNVPHEARWGRFRLESSVRLIGFVLPDGVKNTAHPKTGAIFDCNTFYVVFLDANHAFYVTEDP